MAPAQQLPSSARDELPSNGSSARLILVDEPLSGRTGIDNITAATTDPDPEACIPGWYCGYFGTYTVNYERGIWVTHVLGGNIPAYLGTDQPRTFTINGNTLIISETYMDGNRRVRAERVRRRDTETR
jgi:lipocalin-like protein